jgi:rubredoxin
MNTDLKRWLCLGCGFSYDEALGLPEHGLAPGTRWKDVPADWVCPDCGTPNMVQVIDLKDGTAAHSIALGGGVREFYDITSIPNHRTPMVVGFAQDQINRMIQRGRDISIAELLAESTRGV